MQTLLDKINRNLGVVIWGIVFTVGSLGWIFNWGFGRTVQVLFWLFIAYLAIGVSCVLGQAFAEVLTHKFKIRSKKAFAVFAACLTMLTLPIVLLLWGSCFGLLFESNMCRM